MKKVITNIILAATMVLSIGTIEPVQAQNGFLNNLFSTQRGRDRRAAVATQRAESREIQAALNYFDFDAGVVDGVMGGQSRSAIRDYQTYLGFPVTGQLANNEQAYLLSSYGLIANGNVEVRQQILAHPEGARGVMKAMYLGETPPAEAQVTPVAPITGSRNSMRMLCVNIGASGPMDLVKAQFCNLRQLSIEQGYVLLETAPNPQSLGEVMEKCEVFAGAMAPFVDRMGERSSDDMIAEMSVWVAGSGMAQDTLSRIAETCLGAGYAADNADVALASLAALSGLINAEYLELMGYHIAFGLGFEGVENTSLAGQWMEHTIAGLPEGRVALTEQESGQRAEIIIDVINILAAQN